jgi:hypothetical protein
MNVSGRDIQIRGRLIRMARLAADKYEYLDDPVETIEALRHAGTRIDTFTFMQRLSEPSPKYDYPLEWDNLAAVAVSTYDEWWTKQIDGKTRNMVRRAEKKGLTVREVPFDDDLVKGIWTIYNEVPIRQGKPFAHYGKDLETVRRMSSTFLDRSVFLGAFVQDQLVGFAKLVSDEHGEQAALMHILGMVEHRDKAPTNALIAQAVRSCADRGIVHLVYSNFAYGNKQRDSLSDFKESNGFKRVDLPRYYVPLTIAGRIALRLGLHRSAADYIPGAVLERLRKIRGFWHVHRFQTSRSL